MATITELREEAEALGIDLGDLSLKSEIEAKVAAARATDGDDDDVQVAEGAGGPANEQDEQPEEPVDLVKTYSERARLAGYGSGEAQRMLSDGLDPGTDFKVPNRRGQIPRMVNQLTYAGLEQMIRAHSEVVDVIVTQKKVVAYDLPEDHGMTGEELQDLLVEIQSASDRGDPLPALDS